MPYKKKPGMPTENQKTAAWANIEKAGSESNAAHPSYLNALQAKEYVEENQK